jgi:hypothetical protein
MWKFVKRLSLLNHSLRDIRSHARVEVMPESLSQSTHSTPEIQCNSISIGDISQPNQVPHQYLDLRVSRGHKICDIPLPACHRCIRENGMERVALSKRFPIVFKTT